MADVINRKKGFDYRLCAPHKVYLAELKGWQKCKEEAYGGYKGDQLLMRKKLDK